MNQEGEAFHQHTRGFTNNTLGGDQLKRKFYWQELEGYF